MRSLGLTLAVVVAAAALSGCGKSSTSSTDTSASTAPAPELSDTQKKALQATFPAPYNTADLANGESKFALCASCHTITAGGPNMTGPNLHGVFGRHTHSVDKFSYSDAMKGADFTWDPAHIDKWITGPKEMLPGTKMTFVGLPDPKDRTDVIAYLMVETGYKP
jgi:cytochrome c